MIKLVLVLLIISTLDAKLHPEGKLEFKEYCHYFNYPVEEHVI